MRLSILIPTTPRRLRTYFPNIIEEVMRQSEGRPVEILGLFDNKQRSVGAKRNALLQAARGEFVTFIDDDDRIAGDYIDSILQGINERPDLDCLVFNSIVTINGGPPHTCRYGIEYEYTDGAFWTGKPAHTMIWRTANIQHVPFPDINFGEDSAWVKAAVGTIKVQHRLEKTLYFYDFDDKVSETRR